MNTDLLLLATSWLFYFFIHSLLASIGFKQFVASNWPRVMPAYRLLYNVLALLLLIVPLWFTFTFSGPWLWRWSGPGLWLANALTLLALIGFIWSLKYYDGSEFMGLRQLSQRITEVNDQEQFHLSPLHRWVRHPWYFFGLLLIWTRDMNAAILLSAIMITLYFVIGSRLEETKLIRYHGEKYRRYCDLVPGLIPLPWKFLRAHQKKDLLDDPLAH